MYCSPWGFEPALPASRIKKVVVEALLLVSMLKLERPVGSGSTLSCEPRQRAFRLTERRWAAVFKSVAQELLAVVVCPQR